jgi:hypothetical protein
METDSMQWIDAVLADGEHAGRLRSDLPYFAEHALKLRPKSGPLELFILNPAQRRLHDIIEQQRAKTGRVRVIVLKYNEAAAQKIKVPTGRVLSLLQAYQASEDLRQLAERTRADYVRIIRQEIEPEYSDFPLSGLTDRRTRAISGATDSPTSRDGKPIMRGPCLHVCCPGRRIAAR